MAFDGITIANIVKDLQDNLIDGRLSKIAQPEPDELLCTIKGMSRMRVSSPFPSLVWNESSFLNWNTWMSWVICAAKS